MDQEMKDDTDQARGTFERWLSDGESWIGCFENKDFGSRDMGSRVALCFDDSQWDAVELGGRAPDVNLSPINGIGWRWLLIAKTRAVDEVLDLVFGDRE